MSRTSLIPAVIDWLIANVTASPNLPTGTQVSDAWPGTWQSGQIISIGETSSPSSQGDQKAAGAGTAQPRWEHFAIGCSIAVSVGGADNVAQKSARDKAFSILAAVERLLVTNASMDGLVVISQIGQVSLAQANSTSGAQGRLALISFDVAVQAYLR
jgi:hypothetical protein